MKLTKSNVFHLKSSQNDSYPVYTRCNNKSSAHWVKYNLFNFIKGEVFNTELSKEKKINGRPCIRCQKLTLMDR